MATRRSVISGSRRGVTSAARKALTIEGIDEIQENLARVLNSTTGAAAKKVYVEAAEHGRDVILPLVPVKEGRMRASLFAGPGDSNKPNALLGVNGRIAPHFQAVEYGHAGPHPAPPHPSFRPGLARAGPGMSAIIKTGLLKVIEDAPKP